MRNQVIEPSEIIVGSDYSHPQSLANPWIRFIARFFDYSLFFFLLRFFIWPFPAPLGRWVPIEYFAWIPIEAFLLATWGTTPGKWLLKTEIRKGRFRRLPFSSALRRSFSVWFRGIGMGIVVLNILCMLNAFYRLKIFQITSWDRDDGIIVIHHPIAKWRFYLVLGLTFSGMLIYSFWKKALF